MTSLPKPFMWATLSPIIARFSSCVVSSTSFTWKSQLFPTSVTTGVPASRRALRLASSAQRMPLRRVLPNAATRAWVSPSSPNREKNSASFGFEPGQPPSM